MTAETLLSLVLRLLRECGVESMLTGSLAAAQYATPRSTHDIDLVIDGPAPAMDCAIAKLLDAGLYLDADVAQQAVRERSQFNVIDPGSGWKVDLLLRKMRPFSIREFERRRKASLLGEEVFVPTIEDLIVAKLEWSRLGESERQIRDVSNLIRAAGDALDVAYVDSWLDSLGIRAEWEKARKQ